MALLVFLYTFRLIPFLAIFIYNEYINDSFSGGNAMKLFKLYHSDGIHIITDVKKHKTNIELKTITGEILYIIVVTDENYTVYDDRFAGASKQLNSVEAFDIDGSFRSLDFDNMRSLFKEAFTKLLQEIAECVNDGDELVDLDTLRHKVSAQIKGIHFRVISDTKKYEY